MITQSAGDIEGIAMVDSYGSAGARLGLCNFYREEDLDRLLRLLHEEHPPSVIILSSESGFGRTDFLWTAVHASRQEGRAVELLELDLDAFEPDKPGGLESFVEYQLEKRGRADEEHVGHLRKVVRALLKLGMSSGAWHVLFALGLGLKLEELLWHLQKLAPSDGGPAPSVAPRELLGDFLKQLAEGHPVILHVRDLQGVGEDIGRWLVEIVEHEPGRLFLVVNQRPEQELGLYSRTEPRHLDLCRWERQELKEELDQRLRPNNFPWELTDALMRSTQGRPARIAAKVRKLIHEEVLVEDLSGIWHLSEDWENLTKAFEEDLCEPISRRLSTLESHRRETEDFVYLAALCGDCVPADLLLDHLALDGEAREAVIDWVDDHLVDELEVLVDHQQLHPSFPGLMVYRFFNPMVAGVILEQRAELERESTAAVLLPYFRERLPVATRGIARLFLALCEHLDEKDREPYLRQLAWWVSLEDLDGFTQRLKDGVRGGEIASQEMLWVVYQASKGYWSFHRSKALLDAYGDQEEGIPWDRIGPYHYERAVILWLLGRIDEALWSAREAVKIFTGSPSEALRKAVAWGIVGDILEARGELDEALRIRQEEQLPVFERLGDIRSRTVTQGKIADIFQARGELDEALRLLQEEVLPVFERLGDVRQLAITQGKINNILQDRATGPS